MAQLIPLRSFSMEGDLSLLCDIGWQSIFPDAMSMDAKKREAFPPILSNAAWSESFLILSTMLEPDFPALMSTITSGMSGPLYTASTMLSSDFMNLDGSGE
ncbi:hypothetical protein VK66_15615 [Stenotrophomonas maltophilia]|nr:hypothetical protein VK66_15615 [Stenotrophomonas maltophilia]